MQEVSAEQDEADAELLQLLDDEDDEDATHEPGGEDVTRERGRHPFTRTRTHDATHIQELYDTIAKPLKKWKHSNPNRADQSANQKVLLYVNWKTLGNWTALCTVVSDFAGFLSIPFSNGIWYAEDKAAGDVIGIFGFELSVSKYLVFYITSVAVAFVFPIFAAKAIQLIKVNSCHNPTLSLSISPFGF